MVDNCFLFIHIACENSPYENNLIIILFFQETLKLERRFYGTTDSSNFGHCVANAGDLNLDGYEGIFIKRFSLCTSCDFFYS